MTLASPWINAQEGEITKAENYMELRRQIFVEHGYLIRKLNQAYFAFYGAYAENPVSAAGEDPVGPAVRELRAQSSSWLISQPHFLDDLIRPVTAGSQTK